MTALMVLAAVAMVICVLSLRVALRDGRGPQRPPRSHLEDPDFRAPSG
jgi:hypothetical protein